MHMKRDIALRSPMPGGLGPLDLIYLAACGLSEYIPRGRRQRHCARGEAVSKVLLVVFFPVKTTVLQIMKSYQIIP